MFCGTGKTWKRLCIYSQPGRFYEWVFINVILVHKCFKWKMKIWWLLIKNNNNSNEGRQQAEECHVHTRHGQGGYVSWAGAGTGAHLLQQRPSPTGPCSPSPESRTRTRKRTRTRTRRSIALLTVSVHMATTVLLGEAGQGEEGSRTWWAGGQLLLLSVASFLWLKAGKGQALNKSSSDL